MQEEKKKKPEQLIFNSNHTQLIEDIQAGKLGGWDQVVLMGKGTEGEKERHSSRTAALNQGLDWLERPH